MHTHRMGKEMCCEAPARTRAAFSMCDFFILKISIKHQIYRLMQLTNLLPSKYRKAPWRFWLPPPGICWRTRPSRDTKRWRLQTPWQQG